MHYFSLIKSAKKNILHTFVSFNLNIHCLHIDLNNFFVNVHFSNSKKIKKNKTSVVFPYRYTGELQQNIQKLSYYRLTSKSTYLSTLRLVFTNHS